MGKMSRWQVRERVRRVAEGLNPYHPAARPTLSEPWAVHPGPSQAERSSAGYQAGRQAHSAAPMAYATRVANYLHQNGPNKSSAPELTHLTPAQRKRLSKKLSSQMSAHRRSASKITRRMRLAALTSGRKRPGLAQAQAELRERAFTEPSPRARAWNRREAKRERQGTHGYPATTHPRSH